VSGLLIVANAVFIGIQTELEPQQIMEAAVESAPLPSEHPLVIFTSALFAALFSVDPGLCWASEGLIAFLKPADCSWCVFDIVIVALRLIDSFANVLMWANGSQTTWRFFEPAFLYVQCDPSMGCT